MADRACALVGVDESGTGAWAGPFTVCAYASRAGDDLELIRLGAKDSKKLTDKRRRACFDDLASFAMAAHCSVVEVEDIRRVGLRQAWREAVVNSILSVVSIVGPSEITVDGNADSWVRQHLSKQIGTLSFAPKADENVPVVGAASILAKTIRNDRMIDLHNVYPEYGWDRNFGYGSPEHETILNKIGKTEQHRPWKNLEAISLRS
jgi:ribonuclease HII